MIITTAAAMPPVRVSVSPTVNLELVYYPHLPYYDNDHFVTDHVVTCVYSYTYTHVLSQSLLDGTQPSGCIANAGTSYQDEYIM